MKSEITVKSYDKLIHKMAWHYSNKWGVEELEMYAEGLYVFVLTLNRYQKERGPKFITYFYHRLEGRLDRYGSRESDHLNGLEPLNKLSDGWRDLFIKNMEYYETIATELSGDARDVLGLILQSLQNTTFNRKPSLHGAVRHFQLFNEWVPNRTKKAWEEVKNWWIDFNMVDVRV